MLKQALQSFWNSTTGILIILLILIAITVTSCTDEVTTLETVVVHDFEMGFALILKEQSELDVISGTLTNSRKMEGLPGYGIPAPYTASLHYSNGDVIIVSMYVTPELPTFAIVYGYGEEGYEATKEDTVLIKKLFKITE